MICESQSKWYDIKKVMEISVTHGWESNCLATAYQMLPFNLRKKFQTAMIEKEVSNAGETL